MDRCLIFQHFISVSDIFLSAFSEMKTELHGISDDKTIREFRHSDYLSVNI